jgi:hypothetical protein
MFAMKPQEQGFDSGDVQKFQMSREKNKENKIKKMSK